MSRVRFLGEAADTKRIAIKNIPGFNVSISGFGSIGRDAENHNVFAGRRNFRTSLNGGAIFLFVSDHMVRGKHPDYRLRIFPQKKKRSQTDCGSSVATHGLGNHLRLRQPRELPQDR